VSVKAMVRGRSYRKVTVPKNFEDAGIMVLHRKLSQEGPWIGQLSLENPKMLSLEISGCQA
jgi:hypothetical protein